MSRWPCSSHQVGAGQGRCSTLHSAQGAPSQRLTGPRCRQRRRHRPCVNYLGKTESDCCSQQTPEQKPDGQMVTPEPASHLPSHVVYSTCSSWTRWLRGKEPKTQGRRRAGQAVGRQAEWPQASVSHTGEPKAKRPCAPHGSATTPCRDTLQAEPRSPAFSWLAQRTHRPVKRTWTASQDSHSAAHGSRTREGAHRRAQRGRDGPGA